MRHYLIVLDGVAIQPQMIEFLAGLRDQAPEVSFVLFVPAEGMSLEDSPAEAERLACDALDVLRAEHLPVLEVIVGEGPDATVWRELDRTERAYGSVFRFASFRRGIHIQRLTLLSHAATEVALQGTSRLMAS